MADTPAGRGITVVSVIGAIGSAGTSLLATLCCVGPLAYTVLGAGGVLAAARLQPWQPWILAASAGFLALGLWSAYRRRTAVVDGQECRVKASRTIRATLWLAAVLTLTVAVLPPVLS